MRTCLVSVIFPATMGWTPACQKRIYDDYTLQEWANWIIDMEDVGWYNMEKWEWEQWVHEMMALHGMPAKGEGHLGDFSAKMFFRHLPSFGRDCGTTRTSAPPDNTKLGVAIYQGNPIPDNTQGWSRYHQGIVGATSKKKAASSSQGRRAMSAERLPTLTEERLPTSSSDDATSSEGSVCHTCWMQVTGYAACQNCGASWKCDGVDQEGHTYPVPGRTLSTFVCPSNRCGALG